MNAFRFKLSLRLTGSSFDPSDLSVMLGMKPTYMWKAGEKRMAPNGAELGGAHDTSYCTFNIDQRDNEDELHITLERVLTELERHKLLFDSIRENNGRIEFFVGWFSVGNTGDTLPFSLLNMLGKLNIDLALDVYGSDHQDPAPQ